MGDTPSTPGGGGRGRLERCERTYRHLARRLIRLAVGLGLNAADAEDCVQDVFVALILRRSEVRDPEAWLRRSLFRCAIQLLRREARRTRLLESRPPARPVAPDPEARLALRGALGALRPKVRRAVVLRYLLELSERDAARRAGYSPASAKQILRRARARLRAELDTD